jgi:hypothetical protein
VIIKGKKSSDNQYEDMTNTYARDLWSMFNLIESDVLEAIDDGKDIAEIEKDILKLLE